jgi:hypothetical protein
MSLEPSGSPRDASRLGLQRLRQLAEHLLHGKLGHAEFDFNYFNRLPASYTITENVCGTAGCALGECPILFPGEWQFQGNDLRLVGKPTRTASEAAARFFGITQTEVFHLFFPEDQQPEKFGGKELSETATKEEVAENILAFIALKEQESAGGEAAPEPSPAEGSK